MISQKLKVTQSLTRRLKAFMISIAIFFIIGALGVYVSSLSFLDEVQQMNTTNNVINLLGHSVEILDASELNLTKVLTDKNSKNVHFNFLESQKILKKTIHESIIASKKNSKHLKLLGKGLDSILKYELQIQSVFNKIQLGKPSLSPKEFEIIKSEVLVALQFLMDARELIRKTQIYLNNESDELFSKIYDHRFRPLLVAVSLSVIFFLFVIIIGFRISKKITLPVSSLLKATDKVSEGDFNYQAPIYNQDEFGQLTETFNKMVTSLKEGRDKLDRTIRRLQRLQRVTTAFSRAMTVKEVIDVTIDEVYKLVDIYAGAIYLYQNETNDLELTKSFGFSQEREEKWKLYSLNLKTPATISFKKRKPVFIEDTVGSNPGYSLGEYENNKPRIISLAALPILIGDACKGVLLLDYIISKKFSESEKEFLMAIGRQCAQALHRSLLYDDLRKSINARDEFLSIASHELKTPLTPLKLQLQLLSRQLSDHSTNLSTDKIMKIMGNSDKQLNRLSRLIEDLLDVSRITTGKLKLNLQKMDMSLVISEVLAQYGSQLEASHNEMKVKVEHDIICEIDQIRIEQVLVNLLMNVVKYAPGKLLEITLKRHENLASIKIKDHGPGIPKEALERIFNRFERIDAKDNVGGLGLGLYISRQIIEAHKGKICVESEIGKGSVFTIELPIV